MPSAGTYTVSCSVASWADGRSLALALDGTSLGTLAVPNNLCNGWRTVSRQVTLPAGTHRLVIRFVGDKQILDRVTVAAVATPTTTVPTTVPTTVQTTLGGTVRLPATVQAENYATGGEGVGYHDTTAGNQGGAYRSDGVDIAYAPSIASYVVTQIRSGEWLEYSVDAPVERDYPLAFRLSSPSGGQFFEMKIDGRSEVTVIAPRTGSVRYLCRDLDPGPADKGDPSDPDPVLRRRPELRRLRADLRRHLPPPFRIVYHHRGGSVSA